MRALRVQGLACGSLPGGGSSLAATQRAAGCAHAWPLCRGVSTRGPTGYPPWVCRVAESDFTGNGRMSGGRSGLSAWGRCSGVRDVDASVVREAGYRFRACFRDRWVGYLALVLVLGLVGGVAMAAVA